MSRTDESSGRFLILDGIDGCGKSTQAQRLVRRLEELGGREVVHLREPGSTSLGEGVREILLTPGRAIESGTEALLFAAARRQMLVERVAPALARGAEVVCERFHASTFAYQSAAGGVDPQELLDLLRGWCGRPRPDLTLILELSPEQASARMRDRGGSVDRIESRGLEFQQRVAAGFEAYARLEEDTLCIDAAADVEVVAERIRTALEEHARAPQRHG
jgi:dTMP kinase